MKMLSAIVFLLVSMTTGVMLGIVLWISAMKRWLSREEMEQFVIRPYVPVVSDLMQKLSDAFYPVKH